MQENYNELIVKLNRLRHYLNNINGLRDTSYINKETDISIYDLYYILKFYGLEINSNSHLRMIDYLLLTRFINGNLLHELKNLNINDDERIFIIPPQIVFHSLITYSFNPILSSLNDLNVSKENIAIYLSNWSHVNAIHRALKNKNFDIHNGNKDISYLLVQNDLIDSYNSVYRDDLLQKIITIPKDIEYSELSKYLDKGIHDGKKLVKK